MKEDLQLQEKQQEFQTPLQKEEEEEVVDEVGEVDEEEEVEGEEGEEVEEDNESESAPGWVEVMVDLLLGLESRQSQLWRSVVEQVFRGIVHQITPAAVQLIANVREKEGEGKG